MEPNGELLEALANGQAALRDSLAGISEEAAAARPSEGRWSVLECVEHAGIAEEMMLARLMKAVPCEPSRNESRERAILTRGANRSRRVAAPDGAGPVGRFSTLAAVWEYFAAVRRRTEAFVREYPGDLRALSANHPLIGPVNGHELVLIMAVHPVRHAEQIREIRALRVSG